MPPGSLTDALRETIATFDGPGSPLTTTEVAERLDLGRRSTYERLDRLAARGDLETKKVGANGRVWWRPITSSPARRRAAPVSARNGADSERTGADSPRPVVDDHTQFELLVEAVDEYAIFMLDPDGFVQTWNEGARKIKGYRADEIVGEHFSAFYTSDDEAAGIPERNLRDAVEHGTVSLEGWRVREDGTRFWATVTITTILDGHGELVGFAKVTRDMTGRREHEQDLLRERDLVERVFETSPVGLAVLSRDGVERVNARGASIYGLTTDDDDEPPFDGYLPDGAVVFDPDGRPVPPERRPSAIVFETGDPVDAWECQVKRPDGTRRWLSVSAAPLEDHGEVERVVVAAEDVTHLREQAALVERQRDDLEVELEEVFSQLDDAFVAIDDAWRIVHANEAAERLLQPESRSLLGTDVREAYPTDAGSTGHRALLDAMETQEPTSVEEYLPEQGVWVEVRAYPSEAGLSVYLRDVTERRERERERELYRTVFDAIDDGVYVLDAEFRFIEVNEAYAEMTGYDREELLGAHCTHVIDEAICAEAAARFEEILAGEARSTALEADIHRADGSRLRVESKFTAIETATDDQPMKVGVVRDVSRRVERERALVESERRYRTLVDNFPDGLVLLFDQDMRYLTVGGEVMDGIEHTTADLEGQAVHDVVPEAMLEHLEPRYRAALDGVDDEFDLEFNDQVRHVRLLPVTDEDGTVIAGMSVSQDVTDQVERERELERHVEQQEAITALGRRALAEYDLDALMAEASEIVADTLGNDFCKVLDLNREEGELLFRQGVGWEPGLVGSGAISATENDSQAAYTLQSRRPVVVEDLATETRFSGSDVFVDHDVRSGVSTIIGPADDPWGVFGTHDRERRRFSDRDVNFVQSVANILATAIARHEYEEELIRQREHLAALDDLNGVVRDLSEAVIEQSTREEIERVICEGLAAAESYEIAWIGEVDAESQTMAVRTEAGVEGFLDDYTIPTDPDRSNSGIMRRAIRTHEMQVTEDIFAEEAYEHWRDRALKYGYRSSASIPIVHDEVLYGVLSVYADRPYAFSADERGVISHLGDVVGQAIATVEQKRALTSEEVVQLDVRVPNARGLFDLPSEVGGAVTLDRSVPVAEGVYLQYGTIDHGSTDVLDELVEKVPFWESVRLLVEEPDAGIARFELRLVDPPLLSAVAAFGGYVDRTVIDEGDALLRIHLAPGRDVRQLLALVEEAYPEAQLVSRQQVSRTLDSTDQLPSVLAEHLTERQHAVLEAAYFGGYFEWPRDSTGEEIADSLGIAAATFHQHLRIAQRTVLQVAMDEAVIR